MDTMEYKGFKAQIMEAERLTGDHIHELPSGNPLNIYSSDEFIQWPINWCKKGAFLVPVRPDKGLWFNWRQNFEINTAVLPTVKGCNPITGLQTSGFHLEKYEEKCPKHKCDFLADRFCPECNFKWPDRNYCSMSPLWWDGWFNSKDGTVRQFFFTEEMMRDVATHLIGKENTVPAFGFAFYTPKEMRQEPERVYRGVQDQIGIGEIKYTYAPMSSLISDGYVGLGTDNPKTWTDTNNIFLCSDSGGSSVACSSPVAFSSSPVAFESVSESKSSLRALNYGTTPGHVKSMSISKKFRHSETKNVEVSVGAGAKIRQELNKDPYPLDSWKEKPDAVMTIYFVFQEKFEELKAGGMRDLKGFKEGILQNIPVG